MFWIKDFFTVFNQFKIFICIWFDTNNYSLDISENFLFPFVMEKRKG